MQNREQSQESGRQETQSHIEILTGPEARAALEPEIVRNTVRNLVNTTLNRPPLSQTMSREEAEEMLDRYELPRSILREEDSSTVYDSDALEDGIAGYQADMEGWVSKDVQRMSEAGTMIVAKVNGEVAGIAGYRFIGETNDHLVYEMLRVSVLPQFRGQKILPQLAGTVKQKICEEYSDAVIIVHTKTPKMREWSVREGFRPITCAEYVARHSHWNMTPEEFAAFEKTQKEHGWEYFKLDS